MIDAETLYLAGLVSQATFALTITLLAWSDPQTKGIRWLAGACGIQFVATASRSLWRTPAGHELVNASAGITVLLFFFVYMGLRWFVVRRELESAWVPLAVAVAVLLSGIVSLMSPALGLSVAWVATVAIIGMTLAMLLRTGIGALRPSARVCALALGTVSLVMVLRVIAELLPEGSQKQILMSAGREGTMVTITLMSLSFIALFVAESKRRLHDESRIDLLTGLRNRRAMEEAALREVRLATQNHTSLALLMMDIDKFKLLNDTWGHGLGDRALRALGSVLLTGTGVRDFTARVGGEEFAVLLPGCDMACAAKVAERLRSTVEDLRLNGGTGYCSFTVSIGVSVLHDGERSWSDMLHRADDALYRAKGEGRNRVATCTAEEASTAEERDASPSGWRRRWTLPGGGPLL